MHTDTQAAVCTETPVLLTTSPHSIPTHWEVPETRDARARSAHTRSRTRALMRARSRSHTARADRLPRLSREWLLLPQQTVFVLPEVCTEPGEIHGRITLARSTDEARTRHSARLVVFAHGVFVGVVLFYPALSVTLRLT